MTFMFATCNRKSALGFLQKVCPKDELEDTPESAGGLLDLVEKDILRVQDPMMHGNKITVVEGGKYDSSTKDDVMRVVQTFLSRIETSSQLCN